MDPLERTLIPVILSFADYVHNNKKPAKVNFPTVNEISPKVELQAKRAMAIFVALQRIKEEQGKGVFDERTLEILRKVEEMRKIDGGNTPILNTDESSQEFQIKEFTPERFYHRLIRKVTSPFKIGWDIISLFFNGKPKKKFNLEKLLKEVQAHLGIDLPKRITADEPGLRGSGLAGYYNSTDDELGLLTEVSYPLLKALIKNYHLHPAWKYWIDLIPQTVLDTVTDRFRETPIIKLNASHELTHKRQFSNIQKLTLSEVRDLFSSLDDRKRAFLIEQSRSEGIALALDDFFSSLDDSKKAFLTEQISEDLIENIAILLKEMRIAKSDMTEGINKILSDRFLCHFPPFQEKRTEAISEDELENCKKTLIGLVEASIYVSPELRSNSSGMRKYMTNPCEIEARMESDGFLLKEEFRDISKMERVTNKNRGIFIGALKMLKNFLVDRAISTVLLRIEELTLKKAQDTEIKKEEEKLEALYKLSGWTQTGELLHVEHRARKKEQVGK